MGSKGYSRVPQKEGIITVFRNEPFILAISAYGMLVGFSSIEYLYQKQHKLESSDANAIYMPSFKSDGLSHYCAISNQVTYFDMAVLLTYTGFVSESRSILLSVVMQNSGVGPKTICLLQKSMLLAGTAEAIILSKSSYDFPMGLENQIHHGDSSCFADWLLS